MRAPLLLTALITGCAVLVADLPIDDALVCGSREEPLVAITFDDGPVPDGTPQMLDVLREEGVTATFFMIGARVQAHPELARAVRDAGHELANHTQDHAKLALLDGAGIRAQLAEATAAIVEATGVTPVIFRPPFGWYDGRVVEEAAALGIAPVVWDTNSHDYEGPGVDAIVANAGAAQAGAIILFHDGVGHEAETREAVRQVVRALRAKGLRFVHVSQLTRGKGC